MGGVVERPDILPPSSQELAEKPYVQGLLGRSFHCAVMLILAPFVAVFIRDMNGRNGSQVVKAYVRTGWNVVDRFWLSAQPPAPLSHKHLHRGVCGSHKRRWQESFSLSEWQQLYFSLDVVQMWRYSLTQQRLLFDSQWPSLLRQLGHLLARLRTRRRPGPRITQSIKA